jgi:ketosteroid isomerase-like protein
MKINTIKFVTEWIESWNSHNLDRILSHYSDNFEITTPMIKVASDIETGTLKGKENIRNYREAAFKKAPDLHFELKEVTEGVGSIAIYYKSVLGKMAIEVMFFNEEGKVKKVIAHYT